MSALDTKIPAVAASDSDVMAAPRRLIYVLWAVFWLIMIAVAMQDWMNNPRIRWWEPLLWETSSCVAATAWLALERRYKHKYVTYLDQPLQWFGRHLPWLPVMMVTFLCFVYGVRHGIYELQGDSYRHESWPFVIVYESMKLTLFAGLWLGIMFAFDSFELWQAQRRHLLELQKSLAESQLSQLKAQLRPHFFFNALNTISALMHVDVERADRLLARLGDLLRTSLKAYSQEMSTLKEELRMLELFAQIMQERFADRVTLSWQIDEQALEARLPMMLLQPLLENAFKHGVERTVGPVKIEVAARIENDRLNVTIHNSGSTLSDTVDGIGLRNCRERLQVIYGNRASLQLTDENDGVMARVELPLRQDA